jgi:hypothetical protein
MRWLRPLLWTGGIAALVLGAYAVLGYAVAPRLIKSEVPEAVAAATGQTLTLGEVVVKPFALSIDVRDIRLTEPDGAPLLGARRLFVDIELASIWIRGLVLRSLVLDEPAVNLELRPDGTLNLISALAPKSEPAAAPKAADDELFRIRIDSIAINNGTVDLADLRRPKPLRERLAPINVQLNDLSTTAGGRGRFALAGRGATGAALALNGRFSLQPFTLAGGFAVRNLGLQRAWELGGEYDRIAPPAGTLELATDYRIASTPDGVTVRLDGLGLTLRDVAVRGAGADADWIVVKSLAANGATVDVTGESVEVPELRIDGLGVLAFRGPAPDINLAALAPAPVEQADAAAPASDGAGWRIAVPRIRIVDSRVAFEDRLVAKPVKLELAPLELDIDGFATDAASMQIGLRAGVNGEGSVTVAGTWQPADSAGAFEIDAQALPIVFLQPYVDETTDLILRSGQVSSSGKLALRLPADAAPDLTFEGGFTLAKFASIDRPLKEDFVKFGSLVFTGVSFRSTPAQLRIRDIAANDSYFKLVIAADSTTNISEVLSPPRLRGGMSEGAPGATDAAAPAAAPTADAGRAMSARIDRVRIRNASANFADLTLRPPFATGIQELDGTITGLSSAPDSRAELELTGKVDRYAPVEIDGQVNYLAAESFTDVRASFQNIELPAFTPYSGKFMGYKIAKGKLNATFNYRIENRELDARHKFVIDQLTLGEQVDSPDAVKLPVKLAIALLKDRNGVIDLDLPVSGTLDDPQFRIGPIIWKILVNLLVKIVTAPFALLGSLFGAGEEVRFVDFTYGSADLAPDARDRLGGIGKALNDRPALKLDVPLVYDAQGDREALVDARFDALLIAAAGGKAPHDAEGVRALRASDPDRYQKLVDTAYREASGEKQAPRPERADGEDKEAWKQRTLESSEEALRARITIADSELQALAKQRADAVREAVIAPASLDPARVFVTAGTSEPGAAGGVRLALKVE